MIPTIRDEIIAANPLLCEIASAPSLADYLKPAFYWNPPIHFFPLRDTLEEIITREVAALYGIATSMRLGNSLQKNWVVETGAHVHLPRRFDRANKKDGIQINPLIFQGQVAWAAASLHHGRNICLSLSSSRVSPNNVNSGRYVDFSLYADSGILVSDKWKETPQMLIPRISHETLDGVLKRMARADISEHEYSFLEEVLECIRTTLGVFSDQIVAGHSLIMSKILPSSIKQLSLDGDRIGAYFMTALLENSESIWFRIFSDEELRRQFLSLLQDIPTGWKHGESPFHLVDNQRSKPKLDEYDGLLMPEVIVQKLRLMEIIPKGALKYAALILEGGICSVGGMFQSAYCTQIRDRLVLFLNSIGEVERADVLEQMPTHLATITPCWGLRKNDAGLELLQAFFCRQSPLSDDEMKIIAGLSGESALMLALPALAKLLLGHDGLSYEQILRDVQSDKIIIRK